MKILFAHLLNNYTGSPKVLSVLLERLAADGSMDISLLTSKTDGFLSGIPNITYYSNFYRWHENKLLRAAQFALSQVRNFFFTLFADFDVLYMNTVVPFGAAMAAGLRGKKIVYHVHEVYVHPGFVKRLYFKIMRKYAAKAVCVSNYVRENIGFENAVVIYNPIGFSAMPSDVDGCLREKFEKSMIFMPTSLKEYKGVFQFVELARRMPDFQFVLLCSADIDEMQRFFSGAAIPENLSFVGRQPNLDKFYRDAAVTMNLSLYDKCIETFGLTVLESFDALTPAVAPNYGGCKEIVQDGRNGFLVDPYNLDEVSARIREIMKDFQTYRRFALCAKKRAGDFGMERFFAEVKEVIAECVARHGVIK